MMALLSGRTAFVTGGGSGIGAATAVSFAAAGARVAVADLTGAQDTVESVKALGGEAYAITLDVTDEAAVNSAVDGMVERWGQIDCAFNCAGISPETAETPWGQSEIYDKVFNVNQRGLLICMTAELRYMAKAGRGAIVNASSVAGMVGLAGAGYCSTKHAVIGLTRSAAMQYAVQGIRINAVCPGAIATPMTAAASKDPRSLAFMAQMHPMNRMGQPQEVADAVVFLCSDKASFITGHPLAVDGGYLAR
jgi:NAD(P)-dependent dehydrogenase (short-subunit alcohol dehydrogenase family)